MIYLSYRHPTATEIAGLIAINVVSIVACFSVLVAASYGPNKIYIQIARWVALSDLMQSIVFMFGMGHNNDAICQFQAFTLHCFQLSSCFWMLVLSHTIFCIVVTRQNPANALTYAHLIWPLAAFASLIPLLNSRYGLSDDTYPKDGRICDLVGPSASGWKFLTYTMLVWVSCGIMIIQLIISAVRLKQLNIDDREKIFKYFIYPGVLLFSQIFVTSAIYVSLGFYAKNIHGYMVMSSQGLLNTAVFWYIEDEIRRATLDYFSCCTGKTAEEDDFSTMHLETRNQDITSSKYIAESNRSCSSDLEEVKDTEQCRCEFHIVVDKEVVNSSPPS